MHERISARPWDAEFKCLSDPTVPLSVWIVPIYGGQSPQTGTTPLFVNALIGRQQRGTGNHPMTSR